MGKTMDSQSPSKTKNNDHTPQKNELHFPQIQTPKSNKNDILFTFDNRYKINGMQVAVTDSSFKLHKHLGKLKSSKHPNQQFFIEYIHPVSNSDQPIHEQPVILNGSQTRIHG